MKVQAKPAWLCNTSVRLVQCEKNLFKHALDIFFKCPPCLSVCVGAPVWGPFFLCWHISLGLDKEHGHLRPLRQRCTEGRWDCSSACPFTMLTHVLSSAPQPTWRTIWLQSEWWNVFSWPVCPVEADPVGETAQVPKPSSCTKAQWLLLLLLLCRGVNKSLLFDK